MNINAIRFAISNVFALLENRFRDFADPTFLSLCCAQNILINCYDIVEISCHDIMYLTRFL